MPFKKTFSLFLLFVCSLGLTAQLEQRKVQFELQISANQTLVDDGFNTQNKNGFGIGAYLDIRPRKIFSPLLGIEYNRSNQFHSTFYIGRFFQINETTFHVNAFSVPLMARFNIGDQYRFFFDVGVFAEIASITYSGTERSTKIEDNRAQSTELEVENQRLDSGTSSGLQLGAGIVIPIAKYEVLIKSDVKLGTSVYDSYETIHNRYARVALGFRL